MEETKGDVLAQLAALSLVLRGPEMTKLGEGTRRFTGDTRAPTSLATSEPLVPSFHHDPLLQSPAPVESNSNHNERQYEMV